MKNVFIGLLAILYLTITSGVMVNVHYCMGDVTNVSYGTEQQQRCDNCGMENKDGCCHTDQHFVKAGDRHIAADYVFYPTPSVSSAGSTYSGFLNSFYNSRDLATSSYYPPPDGRLNALRIYNGVFRI